MGRPARIDRTRLLDVARRVFSSKGFEATTLADIAGELGVTAAAVLRHVDSKDVLFAEAMQAGSALPACLEALAAVDASGDQRPILRRFALEMIPLARDVISTSVVLKMHRASQRSLVLPPDTDGVRSRRRRGLRIVEDYFRRAIDAGTIRARDPQSAARLFVGALQAYVIAHDVIGIEPYPVESYVDALIDLWTHGAIVVPKGGTGAREKTKAAQDRRADRGAPRRGRRRHLSRRKP